MRLVATNGPLAGTALALADGLTIGGIDAGTEGSRPCCRIRASEDGGFVLSALDRHTPVFVNGLPVHEASARIAGRAAHRRLALRDPA